MQSGGEVRRQKASSFVNLLAMVASGRRGVDIDTKTEAFEEPGAADEGLKFGRLNQEGVGTKLVGAVYVAEGFGGGKKNDAGAFEMSRTPNPFETPEAAASRHFPIQQQNLREAGHAT